MNNFSDNFVLFVTSLSAIGISILIGLIWKYHESKINTLKLLTFKNMNDEIDAFDKVMEKVVKRLNDKIKTLKEEKGSLTDITIIKKKIEIIETIIENSKKVYRIEGKKLPSYITKFNEETKNVFGEQGSLVVNIKSIIDNIDDK